MILQILIASLFFIGLVFLLVFAVLISRHFLVASDIVKININNNEKILKVNSGSKLLQTLSSNKIFLPSPCGGGGSCGQCRCIVKSGGGNILPTEEGFFSLKERVLGWRLSCQTPVKQNLAIEIDNSVFSVKSWECEVVSNKNVATFIKELVLKLPERENVNFRAGGFVLLEAPAFSVNFKDFIIENEYKEDWDKFKLFDLSCKNNEIATRAYSMANYPEEKGVLKFNIRIATPPPNTKFSPGIMSSYVFNLKEGDKIKVYGPFGEFFANNESNNEMIFIGGGAGMAPLRAHIFDQLKRLKSNRKISFWYGARSVKEMFYVDDFETLQENNKNFKWNVALSDALPEDNWKGYNGFIHQVVYENYLKNHPNPEDCEYYLCGPPIMNKCVIDMLYNDLGVEMENIKLDDFGG